MKRQFVIIPSNVPTYFQVLQPTTINYVICGGGGGGGGADGSQGYSNVKKGAFGSPGDMVSGSISLDANAYMYISPGGGGYPPSPDYDVYPEASGIGVGGFGYVYPNGILNGSSNGGNLFSGNLLNDFRGGNGGPSHSSSPIYASGYDSETGNYYTYATGETTGFSGGGGGGGGASVIWKYDNASNFVPFVIAAGGGGGGGSGVNSSGYIPENNYKWRIHSFSGFDTYYISKGENGSAAENGGASGGGGAGWRGGGADNRTGRTTDNGGLTGASGISWINTSIGVTGDIYQNSGSEGGWGSRHLEGYAAGKGADGWVYLECPPDSKIRIYSSSFFGLLKRWKTVQALKYYNGSSWQDVPAYYRTNSQWSPLFLPSSAQASLGSFVQDNTSSTDFYDTTAKPKSTRPAPLPATEYTPPAPSGGGGCCVISTALAERNIWSQKEKFDLIEWCEKYLHDTWWGEIFRKGYQVLGSKIVIPHLLKKDNSFLSRYANWAFTNGCNLVRGKKFDLLSLPSSIIWIISFMLVGSLVSKKYSTKCWTSLYKGK